MTPATATLAVIEPEQEIILKESVTGISIIPVTDASSYELASSRIKEIIAAEKRVGEYWDPLCDGAAKQHKNLVAKRKELLAPLAVLKTQQQAARGVWYDTQERIRKEAERVAQEAARKQAEDEALARAEEMEKAGDKEGAAEAIEAPVAVPQVVVQSSVPKTSIAPPRKNYSATVTDIKALAKAVIEGKVPAMAIMGNDVFLNAQSRMLKETMNYPGVKVIVK